MEDGNELSFIFSIADVNLVPRITIHSAVLSSDLVLLCIVIHYCCVPLPVCCVLP